VVAGSAHGINHTPAFRPEGRRVDFLRITIKYIFSLDRLHDSYYVNRHIKSVMRSYQDVAFRKGIRINNLNQAGQGFKEWMGTVLYSG
jgi:hypothetical protein